MLLKYKQYLYDKEQTEINSRTEVIQQMDKYYSKLDLEGLKFDCEEASPLEKPRCIKDRVSWLISMFESEEDVHFLRKNSNGIWWHKQGYIFSSPTNKDQYRKIILDPRDCTLGNYEYKKTYKLSMKREC